jgi:CMP-N,N'-diacetyllegionaminic acid synthase
MTSLDKKICALIPARSGSKSIIDKNIKDLNGKPLMAYSIKASNDCTLINETYVSSDSKKYLEIAKSLNSKTLLRPDILATDTASTESVVKHFLEETNCDIIVLIQTTSPLITSQILTSALKQFIEEDLDSLTSVYKDHGFWWEENNPLYDPNNRPMRQNQKSLYKESGMFYIFKSEGFLKQKCRIFGKKGIYVTPKIKAFIEIDEIEDFEIVESIMRAKNHEK